MGLDMFLYRKQFVFPVEEEGLRVTGEGENPAASMRFPVIHKEVIGYWRKANQIHGWFVRNVQEDEDNCAEYEVSREQLSELLKIVEQVLLSTKLVPGKVSMGQTRKDGKWVDMLEDGLVMDNPELAKELLPPTEGFFFGSYDFDEYYIEQLLETDAILRYALESPADADFSYQSSW